MVTSIAGGVPIGGKIIIDYPDGRYQSTSFDFGEPVASEPIAPPVPQMTLYSQNDDQWKYKEYAPGVTFATAGCFVVCVAMIYSMTGSPDDPPVIAEALRRAGCFEGAYLTHPDKIPDACPSLGYYGTYRWHDVSADMSTVYENLKLGPVIMEVDFKPGGAFNQHFVVAEWWNEETGDIDIADPWDGKRKSLPSAYSPVLGGWDLKRAIYGLRLLRLKK